MKKKFFIRILSFLVWPGMVFSQTTGNGPSTSSRTVTCYTTPVITCSPAVTATYTLSNQQCTSVEGNPGVPGVLFGSNPSLSVAPNKVPAAGSEAPFTR